MKPVLLINPNTSAGVTAAIQHSVRSWEGRVDVEVASVPWGPRSVESELDSLVAATAVVELIWARREDYSGFVIACFDDPGLIPAREIVSVPVVGIGEAAICVARERYQQIGVIVVAERVRERVTGFFMNYGVASERLLFASLDGAVADLHTPDAEITERFVEAARRLRGQGAECVVLACAGFSHSVEPIRARVGLPIIDGSYVGVGRVRTLAAPSQPTRILQAPQPFDGQRPPAPSWVTGTRPVVREGAR